MKAQPQIQEGLRRERRQTPLAPRRVRVVVYAVLVMIAVLSIWLIDRRAMVRQAEQVQAKLAEQQAGQVEQP